MFQFSDSDSKDSDDGIRFKTESIRNKSSKDRTEQSSRRLKNHRSRSRSPSRSKYHDDRRYNKDFSRHSSHHSKYRGGTESKHKQDKRKPASSEVESNSVSRDKSKTRVKEIEVNEKYKQTSESAFGPALPPHLVKKPVTKTDQCDTKSANKDQIVMEPKLPEDLLKKAQSENNEICGPQPLSVMDKIDNVQNSEHISTSQSYGPQISPRIANKLEGLDVETSKKMVGPALPPHMLPVKNKTYESEDQESNLTKLESTSPHLSKISENKSSADELLEANDLGQENCGPQLPEKMLEEAYDIQASDSIEESIGAILPPHMLKNTVDENKQESQTIGPVLPHHLLKKTESENRDCQIIGPALPPHLVKKTESSDALEPSANCSTSILPESSQSNQMQICVDNAADEEDEEVYGPLPPGVGGSSRAHVALEERALQLKIDKLGPQTDDIPSREEWMIELPKNRASNLGLGPRQFRAKAGPDLSDRSSWTDTPQDKEKKKKGEVEEVVDLKQIAELRDIQRRDEKQEAIAKKHKKKNKESLLEIHQKKLKKEKQDQGPSERRPFSRELDLQVNRFDEAQKKAVLKKAQLLDDRFSRGKSKYL